MAQGNASEAGAAGLLSNAGPQALASGVGVTEAHVLVVTMENHPVSETPRQIAQSGKASHSGRERGQEGGQIGQQNGQQSG